MSAGRWSTCPKCQKELEEKIKKLEVELSAGYDVFVMTAYDNKRTELTRLQSAQASGLPETLREDWEIYIQGTSLVRVRYSASCDKCNLVFEIDKDYDMFEKEKTA